MTRYEIVPATKAHARAMAPMMREHDAMEVAAMGYDPLRGLLVSMDRSIEAWTGLADGEPVCMFGLVLPSLVSAEAEPWLLSSSEMPKHSRAFLRRNQVVIDVWSKRFRKLRGFVYEGNIVSKRWLRWLGFRISPDTIPVGPQGLQFHYFVMEELSWVQQS